MDEQTGRVTRCASSTQAYTRDQYPGMLTGCGFQEVAFHPSLAGDQDPSQPDLFVIRARKD